MDKDLIELVKQRLAIKTDDKDELIQSYINGAKEYIYNATGKKEFVDNKNLHNVAITILVKEFYENSKDKKDSAILVGILSQLTYAS